MDGAYQNTANFYNNGFNNEEADFKNVNGENSVDHNDSIIAQYGGINERYTNDGNNDTNSQSDQNDNITEPEQFRKVFIGGLSYKTDDETLKNYFAKYGKLVDYVVMKDGQSGRSRGFGFVTYSHSFMVDELMKNRPHIIDGRQVEPKRATPREDSGKAEVQMTVKKLFIGGLRENVTEEDLKSYFSQYGSILEVVIMKEKDTSKSRGFGFVTFDDYDPIDKIILEKHHTINGVNVHTQKALPKDFEKVQNKPQGGGGGQGNKSYHSNQHYNKSDYYTQNTPSNNHHGNSHHHHNNQNPSMPSNFNNFAQMAASFFAAAANKMNPNSSNTSANPPSRSVYGGGGGGSYSSGGSGGGGGGYYPNNSNGSSSNNNSTNNSANASGSSSMNYPMNNGGANSGKMGIPFGMNPQGGSMGTMMNHLMNAPIGGGVMPNMPNGGGSLNNAKMMSNQPNNSPGPMRAGQGKFFNRNTPYATGGGNMGGGRKGGFNRGGRSRN